MKKRITNQRKEHTKSVHDIATLANEVLETNAQHNLFNKTTPLLLMVSGGSDSTALAYVFNHLKNHQHVKHLAAMHVNHKIRSGKADADQEFTQNLCGYLDIPLFIAEVDIPKLVASTGENLEACARKERYSSANDALTSLCNHSKVPLEAGRVVTAHTLDDRVENFYMRSIVGTGPGGFRSMKLQTKNVIRPLLSLTRLDLREAIYKLNNNELAFANRKGELWREDETNYDEKGFRTFVRHSLLPKIQLKNPKHARTLQLTMDLIADEDDMLDEMARSLLQKTCTLNIEENKATLSKEFGDSKQPLQRRAAFILLNEMTPKDVRVENSSVNAILEPYAQETCQHVASKNIQCNLIVSSNKNGVTVEPCASYRTKRKKM